MGKHKDEWARELIVELVRLGRQISIHLPIEVETESKVHRGFIDVAWYAESSFRKEKLYIAVFEIETSKSDWVRIRSNSSKLISLNPAIVCHIFKPGIRLKKEEREELLTLHYPRMCYVLSTKKAINNLLRYLGSLLSKREGLGAYSTIKLAKDLVPIFDKDVKEGLYETIGDAVNIKLSELLAMKNAISIEKYSPCSKCGSLRVFFDVEVKRAICLKCGNIVNIVESCQ